MDFRPHTFRIKTITGGGFNSDGEPVTGTPSLSEPFECRFVQGGKENVRLLPSGTYIIYDYVVYCDTKDNLNGKTIQLFDEGNLVDEKVVKACNRTQLHTILYL